MPQYRDALICGQFSVTNDRSAIEFLPFTIVIVSWLYSSSTYLRLSVRANHSLCGSVVIEILNISHIRFESIDRSSRKMHEVRKPRVWCHTEEYAFSFDDGITTSTSSASPFETIQLKKRNSILDSSKMLTVAKYPRYILSFISISRIFVRKIQVIRKCLTIALIDTRSLQPSRDREHNNTIANYLAIR